VSAAKSLVEKLCGITVVPIKENLIDLIWKDQPSIPANPVFHLSDKFTGRDSADKIDKLRSQFDAQGAWGCIVSALDEICWLFNLRGSDIPFNPVFFSYALVTKDSVFLYVDKTRLGEDAIEYLDKGGVTILPYDQIFPDLSVKDVPTLKLWIDSRASWVTFIL
jgi:Xaa-Pro aminopeptidase